MPDFNSRWNGGGQLKENGLRGKVRGTLSPPTSLRSSLDRAKRSIEMQIIGLDEIIRKLQKRDQRLLELIRIKVRKKDRQHAAILANEVVEVRRMSKMVTQARCALEGVSLRIDTVKDMGDIVSTLAPAVAAVKSVQRSVAGIVPTAEESFSSIAELLSEVLVDAGQSGGLKLNFKVANMEAEKILEEALTLAKKRLEQKLPQIPADIPEDISSPLKAVLA